MASTGNIKGSIFIYSTYVCILNDIQGTSLCSSGNHGDEGCCPEMEVMLHETNDFPFHDILVKYLDTRAPLPSNALCISSEVFL